MLPSKDSSSHVQTDLEIQIVPITTTANFGRNVCLTHENKTPISNESQEKLKPCGLFRAIPVRISSSRIISQSPHYRSTLYLISL